MLARQRDLGDETHFLLTGSPIYRLKITVIHLELLRCIWGPALAFYPDVGLIIVSPAHPVL